MFQILVKPVLKKLLWLTTKESFFIFNKTFYKQSDGVAMGSRLVPTLAD